MRWTTSKVVTLILAICLILGGMWLIYQGTEGGGAAPNAPVVVSNPEQQTANPAALGFGMLAGGVLLIFMSFRKF